MRGEAEYQQALELIEAGVNDCEVGRRLAIPRGTVRERRIHGRSGRQTGGCFRCKDAWVDEEAYAYLLGAYLGDGYLWTQTTPRDISIAVATTSPSSTPLSVPSGDG